MRGFIALFTACAFVSAIGMEGEARQAEPVGPSKGDRESIQGTWRAERRLREGKEVPIEAKLIIAGDHFVVERSDGTEKRGTFKLGPEETPKTIDLIHDDPGVRGKVGRAIYELDGETLRLCSTSSLDSDRPTSFESKEGDGKVVEVFRRVQAPDEGEKGEVSERQKLLDELDEVRVREDVLKWQRDADRNHLQQQVQTARMVRTSAGMGGGFGEGGERLTEEQRKQVVEQQKQHQREAVEQAERSQKQAEADYLKTTRELSRISRKRAELERRVGGEASRGRGSEGPERGVIDLHVQKVGEIVRQVQGEVAKFQNDGRPEREPDRGLRAGAAFLRVGDHIINPDQIVRISFSGERARIFFAGGGDPLILDKVAFGDLERRLPIRGR